MVSFIAGMITGIVVTLVASHLRRTGAFHARGRALGFTLALGAMVLLGSSILMFSMRTSAPNPGAAPENAVQQPMHPLMPTPAAGKSAPSIESAAAGLAERLHKSGGTREDWMLLARSYDFMGRRAEADEARAQAALAEMK
jgi:cytochrome c-type biogenesis protein CcmH/NrfG